MRTRVLGPADFKSMSWLNGRGTTTELAREDDAAGIMLWRLSSAEIVEDGAFSPFPGIDRILMLTEGEGFDLDFGPHGRVGPLELLTPVSFSGDWPTHAENVRGPSRDLNVMATRGRATASITVMNEASSPCAMADRTLILALAGASIIKIDREDFALRQSQLLLVSEANGLRVTSSGSGVLLQINVGLDR